MRTKNAITIRRAPAEVYEFWRNFENLPQFMYHLESVEVSGTTRSTGSRGVRPGRRSSGMPRSSRTRRDS